MQDELVNDTSKLTETDEHKKKIAKSQKKLKMILLITNNKDGYTKVGWKTWTLNKKQGSKYYKNTKKMFKVARI